VLEQERHNKNSEREEREIIAQHSGPVSVPK
jgi:hypothetical protein